MKLAKISIVYIMELIDLTFLLLKEPAYFGEKFLHYCVYFLPQVQDLGLHGPYTKDPGTYQWIRKLLALPLQPHKEIEREFDRLRLGIEDGPRQDLVEYLASQWIHNTTFPVKSWSVFMQPIRTNNDIEG